VDIIRNEILTHRLMIIMKVRCSIVVAFIICHSVFYIGISVITILIFLFFSSSFFWFTEIFFSNYYQYSMDYPSGSDDEDSDFAVKYNFTTNQLKEINHC
jgi:hypothetical protein